MAKDIVKKIDELFFAMAAAVGGAMAAKDMKASGESPAIQAELGQLLSKVMQAMKTEKNQKKAIQIVVRQEGLNKNWTKLLKKYVKKYI